MYYKQWTKSSDDGLFSDFTGLVGEESSIYTSWKFYSGNSQGRPPIRRDRNGLTHRYLYNKDNQPTKKIYEDDTYEQWSYNDLNLITRHRDRLGRVTRQEYDSRGNLTKEKVGLKAQVVGEIGEPLTGLLCQVYDWTGNVLPTDFSSLSPVETVSVPNLEIDVTDRDQRYALLFTGELEITFEDEYDFWIASDDGSKLYINDQLVIDNDGYHGLLEKKTETPILLTPGKHSIRVEFFEGSGAQKLFVNYSGLDTKETKTPLMDHRLSHFSTEETLEEDDTTTPETAERNLTYYPAGHQNEFLLHTEEDFNGNVTEYTYTADNQLFRTITPNDEG
ncbi:MAG: PA14 domain-containing protein, partial [Lentisphaeraceae bacterium]|nr:PA14 domain-containing protein [Lentisphaeraceae bacterium]